MVNAALALKTNLLFDYLPSSIEASSEGSSEAVSSLFAGNSNLLTSKQIGQRLLYSFHVKVSPQDWICMSKELEDQSRFAVLMSGDCFGSPDLPWSF